MKLEDYFDVQAPDDIRIRGHRIGIETVLYAYLHRAQSPEAIQRQYPTLTLEDVYATILYYLHDTERVAAYLANWLAYSEKVRCEAQANPSSAARRISALLHEIDSYPPEEREQARQRIIERERARSESIAPTAVAV